MLGCHDGIPVLDLKGKTVKGINNHGLLSDKEIEIVMNKIIVEGERVKNIYDPSGNKISYYQVNATFFSALGEDLKNYFLHAPYNCSCRESPRSGIWIFCGKKRLQSG